LSREKIKESNNFPEKRLIIKDIKNLKLDNGYGKTKNNMNKIN
jgi:hypothetical protein